MDFTPLLISLPFVAVLLASGVWAGRRFARFDLLPAHFDFRGRVTRMAPRRTMVWMLPLLFSITLMFLALVTQGVPAELQNGSPVTGAVVGGVSLVLAQFFVLWLTDRWARRQDSGN